MVDNVLIRKTESLSTGDKIATDAANIPRDVSFAPVFALHADSDSDLKMGSEWKLGANTSKFMHEPWPQASLNNERKTTGP